MSIIGSYAVRSDEDICSANMKVSLMCQLWSVFPNVQCMHIALVLTVPIASDSVFSLTTITQKAE